MEERLRKLVTMGRFSIPLLRGLAGKRGWVVMLWAAAAAAVLLMASTAAAHPLNNGYSYVEIRGETVLYKLEVPEASLTAFDTNKDGQASAEELNAQQTSVLSYLQKGLQLENNTVPLSLQILTITPSSPAGIPSIDFQLEFHAVKPISSLTIRYNLLFEDSDPLHVNFLIIRDGNDMDQFVFDTDNREFEFTPAAPASLLGTMASYFFTGIKHLASGYDHLLFLLSMLLVVTRIKEAVKIVTAFTAAHSLTLVLAAVGAVHPNPRWVETGIALSIAYVAAENVIKPQVRFRTVLAFLFGLIHGLGFAGALADTGLPAGRLGASLFSFNLGLEAGQLVVVSVLLPLLLPLHHKKGYRIAAALVSSLIFLLAVYWAAERLHSSQMP